MDLIVIFVTGFWTGDSEPKFWVRNQLRLDIGMNTAPKNIVWVRKQPVPRLTEKGMDLIEIFDEYYN